MQALMKFGQCPNLHSHLFLQLAGFSSENQTAASCAQNSFESLPTGDKSNLQRISCLFEAMQGMSAPNQELKKNDFWSLLCGPTILLLHENSEH
jgi:hypothetical protein